MATHAANLVNPNAEIVASSQCLMVNTTAHLVSSVSRF